jgi:hypothetical protein
MRWRRWVLVLSFAWAATAFAQITPDAGLPDGSVGQGGADQNSEEADQNDLPCLTSQDCDGPFTCDNGRCVPAPIRHASCGAGTGALALVGIAALIRMRKP